LKNAFYHEKMKEIGLMAGKIVSLIVQIPKVNQSQVAGQTTRTK
jgi:hypothetical protein